MDIENAIAIFFALILTPLIICTPMMRDIGEYYVDLIKTSMRKKITYDDLTESQKEQVANIGRNLRRLYATESREESYEDE